MVLPKNTFVLLAGQNAWHTCAGEALPRISGKYLPSQLRTQKAGPLPDVTWRCGVGAAGWLRPNGSAKKLACGGAWRCCAFGAAPNSMSNRPSAEAAVGSEVEPARMAAAASITRRRRRG